jgi:methyl-CpG-binding domain protein 4
MMPLRDDLMVQQQIKNSWEHMIGVIMLNQTGRKSVKTVLPKFLDIWPTPEDFLSAHHMTVKKVIRPLGMVNVRYKRLKQMTKDYITWDGVDATDLYGIGKYGSDSYEIFFKGNYNVIPTDKELKRYLGEEIDY